MAELKYDYLEDENNPLQRPHNRTFQKDCDRCFKKYAGTKFQRWCCKCRAAIKSNYWEENEVENTKLKSRRITNSSYSA
jgi:hypothetical protein